MRRCARTHTHTCLLKLKDVDKVKLRDSYVIRIFFYRAVCQSGVLLLFGGNCTACIVTAVNRRYVTALCPVPVRVVAEYTDSWICGLKTRHTKIPRLCVKVGKVQKLNLSPLRLHKPYSRSRFTCAQTASHILCVRGTTVILHSGKVRRGKKHFIFYLGCSKGHTVWKHWKTFICLKVSCRGSLFLILII
jgi:hypothetical protein